MKKSTKIIVSYNIIIATLAALLAVLSKDTSGFSMVLIPVLLVVASVVHSLFIVGDYVVHKKRILADFSLEMEIGRVLLINTFLGFILDMGLALIIINIIKIFV